MDQQMSVNSQTEKLFITKDSSSVYTYEPEERRNFEKIVTEYFRGKSMYKYHTDGYLVIMEKLRLKCLAEGSR